MASTKHWTCALSCKAGRLLRSSRRLAPMPFLRNAMRLWKPLEVVHTTITYGRWPGRLVQENQAAWLLDPAYECFFVVRSRCRFSEFKVTWCTMLTFASLATSHWHVSAFYMRHSQVEDPGQVQLPLHRHLLHSDYLKEAIIRDFKSVEAMKDKVIAAPSQIPDSVQCLALASLHVKHL